jgi:DNA-binding PadR family transcriptional regulator
MKLPQSLGQFEQLVLLSVMVLAEQAYGMEIYSKVCELAGRQMSLGSTYVTLDRMQRKRYISSRIAAPRKITGTRRKYYRLLPAGRLALRASMETAIRLADAYKKAIGKP